MLFRLFGEVTGQVADRPVLAGLRRRERALAGLLLLEVGRVVPVDRLLDLLWDGAPPEGAAGMLRTHLSHLRRRLAEPDVLAAGVRLVTVGPGYLIDAPAEEIDAHRFAGLVARAGRLVDPTARVAALDEALGLWQGPPLFDVASPLLRQRVGGALEELRLVALEQRAEAALAAGRHAEVAAELRELITAHPTRERLVGSLALALYRLGDQPAALEAFAEARRGLADALGVDPGPELRALQLQVLRGDPALAAPPAPAGPGLLPADLGDFIGRGPETDRIRRFAKPALDGQVVVCVVTGAAGIGKTSLAVHAAHTLRAEFPGGQLYVDLRGFTAPLDPADALARFLRALGVTDERLPAELDERAALFRARTTDRPLLVVLDNAADAAQVRPLLPGTAALVLVTSRNPLGDLDGAHRIRLEPFDDDEGLELLSAMAGSRVDGERAAAAEIVRRCGHLPLAVRIAAARLAARPHLTLARLSAGLADEHRRLDQLTDGGRDVRASLELSYRAVPDDQRVALRRLALLDAPDFADWVVGALLDTTDDAGQDALDALVELHLVEFRRGPRYHLHDLVRDFGRERARAEDAPAVRAAAVGRALGGWLALTDLAGRRLETIDVSYRPRGTTPRRPPVDAAALVGEPRDWFDTELPALGAAVRQAASLGLPGYPWEIAWNLEFFLRLTERLDLLVDLAETAHAAAVATGDPLGAACALSSVVFGRRFVGPPGASLALLDDLAAAGDRAGHRWLSAELGKLSGNVRLSAGQVPAALDDWRRAVRGYVGTGDLSTAGLTLTNLWRFDPEADRDRAELLHRGIVLLREAGAPRDLAMGLRFAAQWHEGHQRWREASALYDECLTLIRQVGDRGGLPYLLTAQAAVLAAEPALGSAEPLLDEAAVLAEELSDAAQLGMISAVRGRIAAARGDLGVARARFEEALDLAGPRPLLRAPALVELADVRLALGDGDAAARGFAAAAELYQEMGDGRRAAELRDRAAAGPARDAG
ncbi:BTAD domain-containing putative transcriptional regulator [Longispora sp. K20-0274]|uniref:AfsR/SARP family transcriptional regulator n=1 Tax=Longispora sp. K20-0274 TaxID=3088255 RepID=UPI00399A9A41